MIVTQTINVHLDKHSTPTVETVQSDTGRAVEIKLYSNGQPWTPPHNATGTVRYSIFHEGEVYTSTYDTLPNEQPSVRFSENVMTLYLTPAVLSIVGVGELQIGITHAGYLIATLSILLRVQRNIGAQGIQPKVYTDLTQHIQNEVVRQYRQVYDQGSWLENLHHRVATDFSRGGISDPESLSRISSDMIFHGGRAVTVSFPAGLRVRCCFYDEDYRWRSETVFFEEGFTHFSPWKYMRLEAGYTDDGTVEDLEVTAGQIGIFYPSEGHDNYRGSVESLGIGALAECCEAGYYSFTAEDLEAVADGPGLSAGGILEVHPHGPENVMLQTLRTDKGEIWFRRGSDAFRPMAAGLTEEQVAALDGMFRLAAFTADASEQYEAFRKAFGLEGEEHRHSYTSQITKAPTCQEEGMQIFTCDCGHSYSLTLPASGHNFVDGICTGCGAADSDSLPEDGEPVYRLEETVFDGTNHIDTGVTLLNTDKNWSICVAFTPTHKQGRVFDTSHNTTGAFYIGLRGGHYWDVYALSNYVDIGDKVNQKYFCVITHTAGTNKIEIHYLSDGAVVSASKTVLSYADNTNVITEKPLIIGANYTKADMFKGTIHAFEAYERVVSTEEISAFMEVSA